MAKQATKPKPKIKEKEEPKKQVAIGQSSLGGKTYNQNTGQAVTPEQSVLGKPLQKFSVGNKEVSKEEYQQIRRATFGGGAELTTPTAQEAVNKLNRIPDPNVLTPEQQALAQQQTEELRKLDELKQNTPQLSTSQRNQAAGLSVISSLGDLAGIDLGVNPTEDIKDLEHTSVIKAGMGALGVLATTGIKGVSLSSIFAPTSSNINNLERDASEMTAESKRIATAALSRGADVQQAIESQRLLEEGIRMRYQDAMMSLRNSPKDIREGLDLVDSMSRDLRNVIENRQALERYLLTRDPNEIMLLSGAGLPII
jgi:hypothetical protein